MNRKIIIGYDGSPAARTALDWALDEATRTGAPAEIVYADQWPVWTPAASMVPSAALRSDGYVADIINGMIDDVVSAARKSHPLAKITGSTVRAHPATALINLSREARMVVVGSRGHSTVANLLGSVSSAVSAHAHCPVVVVRGDAPVTAPVVAGIDGSALASQVLNVAAQQAAERKTQLRVIRAWPPVTGLWEDSAMVTRTVTDQEREPFDTLVTTVRDIYPELDIEAEATVAHPAAALTRAAGTAQLLVVGSRGRGAVRGMLLGSVSQHLLRHAACTVAVVHLT